MIITNTKTSILIICPFPRGLLLTYPLSPPPTQKCRKYGRGIFQYGHPPVLRPVCLFTKVSSLAQPSLSLFLHPPLPIHPFHLTSEISLIPQLTPPFLAKCCVSLDFGFTMSLSPYTYYVCLQITFSEAHLRLIDCIMYD